MFSYHRAGSGWLENIAKPYKSKHRPQSVIDLYFKLKERILQLGDEIEIKYQKQTIGFKRYQKFTDIIIWNGGLGVVLNLKKGELNDPLGKTEDLSDKGKWGVGDYRIWLSGEEDFEYTIDLIKQSYNKQGE